MEVSPRKLIWADGMVVAVSLRSSQLAAHRCPGPLPPPPVDGDWAGQMLSLRRRGRGIRNPSRSFGLPADQECSRTGSGTWWPWLLV